MLANAIELVIEIVGTYSKQCSDIRPKNGQPTNQMAEGQETLGREVSVGKLVTEEHPDDGRDRKCVQNPGLFRCCKTEPWQVTKNQWQPRPPNEELQKHHGKEASFHSVLQ
jgi:hypothetical protein